MKQTQWICPYLNLPYSNSCPVKNCHSNCGNKLHPSSCLHNIIKGDVTIDDLAFITKKPRTVIEKRYENGLKRLRDLVELDKFLDNVREYKYFACDKCGVLSKEPVTCDGNDSQCASRQYLTSLILKLYPLNAPPLETKSSDVWRLIKHSKQFDKKRERKLYDILQLSKSLRKRLETILPMLG